MIDPSEGPDQGMTVRVADRIIARGKLRRTWWLAGRPEDQTACRTGDRQRRAAGMAGKINQYFTVFYRPKKFRAIKPGLNLNSEVELAQSRQGAQAE